MFDISFSQNVNNASGFPVEVTPRHFNKKIHHGFANRLFSFYLISLRYKMQSSTLTSFVLLLICAILFASKSKH